MAKIKKKNVGSSAFKIAPLVVMGIVQAGIGIAKAVGGGIEKRKQEELAREAKERGDKYMDQYRNFDPRVQNPYEDLTVNLQQADYMKQQQAQQSADTLQQLRGVGGGAGAAALATAMSRQGALNAQRASASIAQQERQNQLRSKGFEATEEKRVKEFNLKRIQDLGAYEFGTASAATAAGQMANQQMWGGIGDAASGIGSAVGGMKSGDNDLNLEEPIGNIDSATETYEEMVARTK